MISFFRKRAQGTNDNFDSNVDNEVDAYWENIDENLDEINTNIEARLAPLTNLKLVHILCSSRCEYGGIVFVQTEADAEKHRRSSDVEKWRSIVREVVSEFRTGECDRIDVELEIDSHERVLRDFGGDYMARLR